MLVCTAIKTPSIASNYAFHFHLALNFRLCTLKNTPASPLDPTGVFRLPDPLICPPSPFSRSAPASAKDIARPSRFARVSLYQPDNWKRCDGRILNEIFTGASVGPYLSSVCSVIKSPLELLCRDVRYRECRSSCCPCRSKILLYFTM